MITGNISDYEKQLVQVLAKNQEVIPKIAETLLDDDFSNTFYSNVYKAEKELFESKEDINDVNLLLKLKENNIPFSADDIKLILEDTPVALPSKIAEVIRQASVERKVLELQNTIGLELKENQDTLSVIGNTKKRLEELGQRLIPVEEVSKEEELRRYSEIWTSEEEIKANCIKTPYKMLSYYLDGGYQAGLITVGARTGIGKTVVATQSVYEACEEDKSVLFFSLEMPKEKIYQKLVAMKAGLLLNEMRPQKGRSEETLEKIRWATQEALKWKLTIISKEEVTLELIKSMVLQAKQKKEGVDLVVIDYLQLISTKGLKYGTRQEAVAEMSRSCKILSMALDIPIMILVQLNRHDKNDSDDRLPTKEDIKESGAIASDSDVIILIHRKYDDDSTDKKALIILDKNRYGQANKKIKVRNVLEKGQFVDIEEETTENLDENNSVEWGNIEDIAENTTDFTDEDLETIFDD